MKKKKGFTLIELISVLVILAILALIVTPLVLNIIKKARTAADKRKILFAGDAISNRAELGKYWIQFMIQPDKCAQTLVKICNIKN